MISLWKDGVKNIFKDKIEVYNLLGIQVVNHISEGVVDFSNLPSGYYIVKVYTNK
jgi:hypothetical protein